jgi:hypothetical protein
VAHACNPSYSGGRDQEDYSLRPVWAKKKKKRERERETVSKIPNTQKKSWWSGSSCRALLSNCEGLGSNPSTVKNKKEEEKRSRDRHRKK